MTIESAATIASSCDAISQRVISTSSSIDHVVKGVNPESYKLQRLLALSGSLSRLRNSIDRLREALAAATVSSNSVQSALNVAIQPCADATSGIEDQVQKLQLGFNIDSLNVSLVAEYSDHQIANARLFEILAEVLPIPSSENQEARYADLQGQQVLHKAVELSAKLLQRGETPLCEPGSAASGAHPYGYSPGPAGEGRDEADEEDGGFFSSFSHSLKAMTSALRAKPLPIVVALCESAKLGNVAHLRGFVAQGVNINGQNEDGYTALICAARANQVEAIRFLISAGADITARDSYSGKRKSALFHAAECGHLAAADVLLGAGADPREKSTWIGTPAFIEVACSDHVDILKLFLDRGADPKVYSNNGRSVFIHALRAGKLEQLRLLHKYGADLDSSDISGLPVLHVALNQNRMDIIEFLLQHGANINSRDLSGNSMLDVAVQKTDYELMEFLLGRGANPNTSDYLGRPLIARLVDRATADENDTHTKMAKMVLQRGADPNQADSWGEPLLTHVMTKGNTALLTAFLEHRVNPNKPFRRNETPLLYALSEGRFHQALLLLEHGADPNLANGEGKTALVEAIVSDQSDLVDVLLEKGADIHRAGQVKPAALAKILNNPEVCRMLVGRGAERPTTLPSRPALAATTTTSSSSGAAESSSQAAPRGAGGEDTDDLLPAYSPPTPGV